MKTITVKRWAATTTQDVVTIKVPDDFDTDDVENYHFEPYDFEVVEEDAEILDVTDTGPWELA